MANRLGLSILVSLMCPFFTDGSKLTAEDVDSIKISLLPESERPLQFADKDKPILRYGFHRTHDCQDFEKAFICVRKCLDLNYHIAHANKNCICTCYKNRILAKYKTPLNTPSTKWKLGAPTTSRPGGAGGNKPNDYEINANYSEFIEDLDDSTVAPLHNAVGDIEDSLTPDVDSLTGDVEGSGDVDDDGENPGEAEEQPDGEAEEDAEADSEAEPEAEEEAEKKK